MIFFLVSVLILAVAFDVTQGRIPNKITFSGMVIGFLGNVGTLHIDRIESSVFGFCIAGVFAYILYICKIGGGDQKLLLAIGSMVGMPHIIHIILAISIAGGLQGLLWVLWAYIQQKDSHVSLMSLSKTTSLPYAISIFAGTVFFLIKNNFVL